MPCRPLDADWVPTVADAMVRFPKTCDPTVTLGAARSFFTDDHVHALLVVDAGTLVTVLERADLPATCPDDTLATSFGSTAGRLIGPDAELDHVWRTMRACGRRRLAVVVDQNVLLGLLCLKRSGFGFCSDAGVRARARESAAHASAVLDRPFGLSGEAER